MAIPTAAMGIVAVGAAGVAPPKELEAALLYAAFAATGLSAPDFGASGFAGFVGISLVALAFGALGFGVLSFLFDFEPSGPSMRRGSALL